MVLENSAPPLKQPGGPIGFVLKGRVVKQNYRLPSIALLLAALYLALSGPFQPALGAEDTYDEKTILAEAASFFGEGAKGLAKVIEKVFQDLGRPNAYIKGEEAGGALVVGLRYGNGNLFRKAGGGRRVHWSSPSVGFDAGGNLAKVFVLVYNLRSISAIYQRFPAVDGSLYYIAGVGVNYHRLEGMTLAPIRLGVGLRAGVSIGYIHYRRTKSWNPF